MTEPRLTLDLKAIEHNVAAWRARVGAREVWAVVKSDGYRLGAARVAEAAIAGGAARLCVIDLHEAAQLRAARVTAPILMLRAAYVREMLETVVLGVVPTVADADAAAQLAVVARDRNTRVAAHVAIDTGTGWSGITPRHAAKFARVLRDLPGVDWEGAWTHIAGRESLSEQTKAFEEAVRAMRTEGLPLPCLHLASTGPTAWGSSIGAVRIGVGLYGSALGEQAADLRQALCVRAPVVYIKRFDETTPLGYGGTHVAQPGQTVVTLRAGYADGMPRAMNGRGVVRFGKATCPIVGAIGMNYTMALVPDGTNISSEDEAEIVGEGDGIRLDDLARAAGTIPHAVVTAFGAGIAR